MTWNFERAKKRIAEHKKTIPTFDDRISLVEHMATARKSSAIEGLTSREAFVIEGAHLYGHILDYDRLVADNHNAETEQSHAALLSFLDAQYQLWDTIVSSHDADRVDYHSTRLHAVITEPKGNPRGQIQRAMALAETLTEASRQIASRFGLDVRLRFGIDQGKCLAMTTGRAHERDVLFLGAPANYAAKLAAGGSQEGIFLAPKISGKINPSIAGNSVEAVMMATASEILESRRLYQFDEITRSATRIASAATKNFTFFTPSLPLSDLKFRELTASHTARLPLASIFADIDGFTKFVDEAIRGGSEKIKLAASAIHVIREELNDVLQKDFGGKRIRFIGDCIHGALAADKGASLPAASVRLATLCATGMMSSFKLCKQEMQGIDTLGLAIGVEFGESPITRLGLSGDESIRCAAGRAIVNSERVQQGINGSGIALGAVAAAVAETSLVEFIATSSGIPEYDSAIDHLQDPLSPAFSIISKDRESRPHTSTPEN